MNNNDKKQVLDEVKFLSKVKDIDRITSSVLESSISIFLPFKRIDKTDVYKKFVVNNQILEIRNDLFDKVEVRGRLLAQGHKDILEVLLSSQKIFSQERRCFFVKISGFELGKKLGRNVRNKKWLINQIKEIAESRINIYFKDNKNNNMDYNFGFISSVLNVQNGQELEVYFTQEYTYFLATSNLLDYKDYIQEILLLDKMCNNWSKQLELKHQINSDFIKAIVRYMLTHKGNNSQISIQKLLEKLNYRKIISKEQLQDNLTDLKRPLIQEHLRKVFGITLTANETTITFNKPMDKNHYFVN